MKEEEEKKADSEEEEDIFSNYLLKFNIDIP